MSEGLAEIFCMTDPSREDNPVVFASEEFYRLPQYGAKHTIGRNCRFFQGPNTNAYSVERIKSKLVGPRNDSQLPPRRVTIYEPPHVCSSARQPRRNQIQKWKQSVPTVALETIFSVHKDSLRCLNTPSLKQTGNAPNS
ncbi:hypothetical protein QBC38DRAFT_161675 [Podospora fimiseda]|uniref:PAS domain-containing protein n=1 Tax=Podospora fimiseda TaxID=252190 RepID=A0AAN7H3K8_9PEZI|nr:hypothetical protein QBC38DRAFT_161675 [Podospora fimiseda]